jgi:hypothetical protein
MHVDYRGADFVCKRELLLDFVLACIWVSGHSGEATPSVEVWMQMKASRGAVKTMNKLSTARPLWPCRGAASIAV